MGLATTSRKIASLIAPDGVPEILVDGFHTVSVVNGIARLNFFSLQASAKGETKAPTLVCRLALSMTALSTFRKQIDELVDDLTSQQLIKADNASS